MELFTVPVIFESVSITENEQLGTNELINP